MEQLALELPSTSSSDNSIVDAALDEGFLSDVPPAPTLGLGDGAALAARAGGGRSLNIPRIHYVPLSDDEDSDNDESDRLVAKYLGPAFKA